MGRPERREGIANGTIKAYDRPGRPTLYIDTHPEDLVLRMSEGQLDVEIYSAWGIGKECFYKWRRENPDLEAAFKVGYAKCEAYYAKHARQCMLDGNDAGFKYFIGIMNNKFGWGKGEGNTGTTNNTININGNMNVVGRSDSELLEALNQNLDILRLPTVDAEFKQISHNPEDYNED